MAKSTRVEDILSKLAALEALGPNAIVPELIKHLASKTSLVVAKAADLATRASANSLEPQLAEAFNRFMVNGQTTDKGCAARKAIANALYELSCDSDAARDVHLAGVRHVQMEPIWGGSEDTAGELRGICALGLVRVAHRGVMEILVDLLTDPSHQARILAARAVAYSGREEGALLLRLKILAGDREDTVTCECLDALGRLSGVKALDFLERFLDTPHLQDAAAMAIGQLRRPGALAILLKHWDANIGAERRIGLLLPIALSRLPEAVEFLADIVASKPEPLAVAALDAMRLYRRDSSTREKIFGVVQKRNSPAVFEEFGKVFDE